MREREGRGGSTLMELMLCVAVIGVMAGVAVPMVRARTATPALTPELRIAIARRKALETGSTVTIDWTGDTTSDRPVTIWPDGHVTTDSSLSINRMNGMLDTVAVRTRHLRYWVPARDSQ